jgi:excisionase family DNA binding protein
MWRLRVELTTQAAADLLNVSRPHLIKLVDEGKIPYKKVGIHRRIRFQDLMNYKAKQDAEQRRLLAEMAQFSQDLNLYDDFG